jgi:hypothetical protein
MILDPLHSLNHFRDWAFLFLLLLCYLRLVFLESAGQLFHLQSDPYIVDSLNHGFYTRESFRTVVDCISPNHLNISLLYFDGRQPHRFVHGTHVVIIVLAEHDTGPHVRSEIGRDVVGFTIYET